MHVLPRDEERIWITVATFISFILNSSLLAALTFLAFDPQRAAFGRATGLWHPCESLFGATTYDRWSPLLLLLILPAVAGFLIARELERPASTASKTISIALALLAIALVLVPTGSCVS